ncbi:DUF2161 family putative PD-(D/E)XK-type phosphodiesterase [Lentilitoribacter sp. Alg239-R112]|uniref:DUF2161 domain-containing phosphodiesterase n=1 Tax=Lentilitoribacter sp. Alg239-R112 TaxID=2305987 RepID=UPI0013A707DC|nr:DUF2161 family putative PD-(D/E)XK-type phosphodiesterase [Lentilitoribacter sp. Alg239-R112]
MPKTKPAQKPRETDLYAPVKALLEGQGYEVKGEIGKADIVAVRTGADGPPEAPIVVELKTAFSLSLFHQGIDRQSLTDDVYIAVPRGTGKPFLKALKNNKNLCRRLGLGLITVRLKDGFTEIHLDPAPYQPRQSKIKKSRLLREFATRVGDPNQGGAARRTHIITAYRQDALRCLQYLNEHGPTKASIIAKATDVSRARTIMAADHYGWFERIHMEQDGKVLKGIYGITPKGELAVVEFKDALDEIDKAGDKA